MPALVITTPASVQKLFDWISHLPLSEKQFLFARHIVLSLKKDEHRAFESLMQSDKELAKKLMINSVKTFEHLSANDHLGVQKIIKDDAAILAS